MRTTVRRFIPSLALLAAIVPATAAAQQGAVVRSGTVPEPSAILPIGVSLRSTLSPVEEARLIRRVNEADQLTIEGRFSEAKPILRAVADAQHRLTGIALRADGEYAPGWHRFNPVANDVQDCLPELFGVGAHL